MLVLCHILSLYISPGVRLLMYEVVNKSIEQEIGFSALQDPSNRENVLILPVFSKNMFPDEGASNSYQKSLSLKLKVLLHSNSRVVLVLTNDACRVSVHVVDIVISSALLQSILVAASPSVKQNSLVP